MPHRARKVSSSGYYHAVPKGINDQVIFEDDDDRIRYRALLAEARDEYGLCIHAYCLMSNHAHLILEDPKANISAFMKYVHERYAMWFAAKTGRIGGIFRKPYWSEPIESNNYLLCAVRYVHANPAAAGICPASMYSWSSAKDYLGRQGITETAMVLNMLGGKEGFIDFSRLSNSTAAPFPGSKLRNHLTDDEAITIAKAVLGEKRFGTLKTMNTDEKAMTLKVLVERGFSFSQLVRITGISRSYINKLANG